MSGQAAGAEAVLADLKDFQRRTALWAFNRMFADADPAIRFLVADEVGLGKTHVAKGVIAQVIDHLRITGDERHDIVYVCSNAAIARQNLRKLAPEGVEPLKAERLTMLPLAELSEGDGQQTGVNLLAITPGTSLDFGRSTGRFRERCLAYAYLRAHWGKSVMTKPARRIFWFGVNPETGDERLRLQERQDRRLIKGTVGEFAERLAQADESRQARGDPTLRGLFDELVDGMWKRRLSRPLRVRRGELISEVRHIMAHVGLDALRPDLVVLDEFQRFKDLLKPHPDNAAAELAQQLFGYRDPDTGRQTRTLLLSATPYRMYTTADDFEGDHYEDFLATCSFLFGDQVRVDRLQDRFRELRSALTARGSLDRAEAVCGGIGDELRGVMARTERLAATPDRSGMLNESDTALTVRPVDLRAYVRVGGLAEAVAHHEPTEYWKSAPYLVNFMEAYKLKDAIARAAENGQLDDEGLRPGPGLLNWDDVEAYERIDPQNARLRWLIDDLESHRAFDLLWVPPSMRYYDAGSVYESPEAASFTKRLLFSGWTVVPKVVSSLVSFEAERRAFAARDHGYTADYGQRGGSRLDLRTAARAEIEPRPGDAPGSRRAAAMTAFVLTWPSPSLAELGDPRPRPPQRDGDTGAAHPQAEQHDSDAQGGHDDTSHSQQPPEAVRSDAQTGRRRASEVLADVETRVAEAVDPLVRSAPTTGIIDHRWYWAAPLFLDRKHHPEATDFLLVPDGADYWVEGKAGQGLRAHVDEARAMVDYGIEALGRPPDDLADVLAELAVGGPAQCALRAINAVTGLAVSHEDALWNAAWIGAAFRRFFNAPEVTAVVLGSESTESDEPQAEEGETRYWRDVLRHCITGHLQAVLDEHLHVLRDWLGYLNVHDENRRVDAAHKMGYSLGEALDLRTSSYRVDVPGWASEGGGIEMNPHRMRSRFAVAFGHQTLDEGGEARIESVSRAFNSPFWPFVLTSTSIGQEGLDFHLWCHAVVHWNLPSNPVDLEQREGRVHRYKGHAVRRNIAATLGPELRAAGSPAGVDLWDELFAMAAARRREGGDEMVPYWVFPDGPARIERLVPVLPFSRESASLPRLRKTLAAYRLAFGQPRQEELVEFLGDKLSDEDMTQLRIDLSPPNDPNSTTSTADDARRDDTIPQLLDDA